MDSGRNTDDGRNKLNDMAYSWVFFVSRIIIIIIISCDNVRVELLSVEIETLSGGVFVIVRDKRLSLKMLLAFYERK